MSGASPLDSIRIGDVAPLAARRYSRRTALFFGRERRSYSELGIEIERLARAIAASNLGPGDRVGVWLENRPETLHLYFALPTAGMVAVPLNTFLSPRELTNILADCDAAGLITTQEAFDRISAQVGELPGLRQVLLIDAADGRPARRILQRAAVTALTTSPGLEGEPAAREGLDRLVSSPQPDDTAVIIYTSGTTGRPKGVMLSHRNLLSNARACIEAVGIGPRDKVLLFLPMFHSFTQTVCMLAPFLGGMGIVLCDKVDRAQIRSAIARWRPTIFAAVPSVYGAMAKARLGLIARSLNPIRLYISGGAPLGLETLKLFESKYRRPLCEGYGLSEAAPVVCLNPPAGPRKPGSVGVPLPGVEIRILGRDGYEAGADTVGELQVRGPNVMKGYFNLPVETSQALEAGWLRTGDLARRDADGYLFIAGRSKDLILYRGMNVYPREIEAALEEIPAIKEAVVVGVPDLRRGEVPHAFVVPQIGSAIESSQLRRACAARLASYKVPKAFWVVEDLPRNPAGKVLKSALRDRAVNLQAERSTGARSSRALRPEM